MAAEWRPTTCAEDVDIKSEVRRLSALLETQSARIRSLESELTWMARSCKSRKDGSGRCTGTELEVMYEPELEPFRQAERRRAVVKKHSQLKVVFGATVRVAREESDAP